VIRERVGRAALRAYQPESRAARGEEVLGTLLDASEHSPAGFGRETGSLLLAGLRERAALTASVGSRRLIADACPQAIAILILWLLRNGLLAEIENSTLSARSVVALIVLGVLLVCAVVGYDRIAGVGGFVLAVGVVLFADPHAPLRTRSVTLAITLVPIVCFAVMALAPRVRPRDPRRLLWLAPAAALAAIVPSSYSGGLAFLAVISLAALVRLPTDPRLALACGLAWATLGLTDITVALSLEHAASSFWIATTAGATVMLTIAATRLRLMQRAPQT
jgi:CTP:molybdopterin cytidylyltransferase MocA